MVTNFTPKNAEKFICEKCDFKCCKKSDWTRHITTRKHKMITNDNEKTPKNASYIYMCNCGKQYKHNSGLSRHKLKCKYVDVNISEQFEEIGEKDDNVNYKEMFLHMMKQNQELQKTMQEIIPNIGNNNNNISNKVNINVFLNEQCKDALNIMDFVNSLKLQITDLENTSKMGFIDGTSKIIIDGLKELELHQRPVHCSDLQNEILYVKDNDTWEQDNENKDKMKRVIDEVTKANMKQLPKWITDNPTYANDEEYMKIVSNIMNMDVEHDKSEIIKNVSKEVTITNDDPHMV
tara:strand:+ start:1599 stop:2474 length:876 start_codon:yes stop_codon:yes gene_type:complete